MSVPFPAQAHSGGWQTVDEAAQLTTINLALSHVELANRFFSQPRLCEFMAEGKAVRCRWEYSGARLGSAVVLQGDDLQLLVHAEPTFSNRSADERPWWEYPSQVQPLAWALENASVLEIFQRLFDRLFTVTHIIDADATEQLHALQNNDWQHSLNLYVNGRQSSHRIHLRLSHRALLFLVCNQRWLETKPQRAISRLVFDAAITMPLGIFNLRELREIVTGDILLTGFSSLSKLPFHISLSGTGNRWYGRGDTQRFVVDTKLQNRSLQNYPLQNHPLLASTISMDTIADIDEVVQSPSTEGALSALDKLDIELCMQVDKRQLSLREIEHLQPGFVFTLPQAVNELKITFLANNIPMGRGELVAIGKQLGVRVIEWNTHGL